MTSGVSMQESLSKLSKLDAERQHWQTDADEARRQVPTFVSWCMCVASYIEQAQASSMAQLPTLVAWKAAASLRTASSSCM